MKSVVITQSNYLPWRGYFAMIDQADELILLESVQYTRRDWRNRNLIKTPAGLQWLTIPVEVKGKYLQAIDQTRVAVRDWAESHIRALETNYRRADAYREISAWLFERLRVAAGFPLLTEINSYLLREICGFLGIHAAIRRCTDLLPRSDLIEMDPTERLLNLCNALGAGRYISGPAARAYMDMEKFARAGIEIVWMDYAGLPEYPQCWGGFEPRVSIADLLLCCGDRAAEFTQRQPRHGLQ
jgi:hypothetical protein